MRHVAITGTRKTDHRNVDDYDRLFADYLAPFANDTRFFVGDARGIDTLALRWLAEHTAAHLTVVTPGRLAQQTAETRAAVHELSDRVELVELGADELRTSAYLARNRHMVDHAELTIGFPYGDEPLSGTWQTLNYAAEQGKPRLIVPV